MLIRARRKVQGTHGGVIFEEARQPLERDLDAHAAERPGSQVDAVSRLATEGDTPFWIPTTDDVSSLIFGVPEFMPGSPQQRGRGITVRLCRHVRILQDWHLLMSALPMARCPTMPLVGRRLTMPPRVQYPIQSETTTPRVQTCGYRLKHG